MQCYTELLPPTAVTHAASLPFISATANNLVVAKTSLLQIFSIKTVNTHQSSGSDGGELSLEAPNGAQELHQTSKLVLIGEYTLSGTVTALARVKTVSTKSGGEALLVSFRDAKLSLVEWDPENYRISTISVHYYEGENVTSTPFGPGLDECESVLTVDPSSRCAALKFGQRHLAILPFRQTGDELVEDDGGYDPDLDTPPPSATGKRNGSDVRVAADGEAKETPYKSSFVLPLTTLDPALTHPVHLAFLYEYREPTFGILSCSRQPSSALAEDRKDILTYSAFTLDLEQRASTTLLSVPNLPNDLWKVIPLSLPIGGALLVGTNELIHVDQAGKTHAVGVNEFAWRASSFGMADQSSLGLRLEDCEVALLDDSNGDMLLLLKNGTSALLTFKLLGRSVAGLNVVPISAGAVEASASCAASFGDQTVFIGSEDGDSVLLGWSRSTAALSRKRSHAQMLEKTDDVSDEEEVSDDDDLYGVSASEVKKEERASSISGESAGTYAFRIHDILPGFGPINNICFGKSKTGRSNHLDFVAATGRGKAGRLAVLKREIVPDTIRTTKIHGVRNVWSLCAKRKRAPEEQLNVDADLDNLLFVYDGETTKVYDISFSKSDANESKGNGVGDFKERTGTDLEAEGETVAMGTLAQGTRIVHIRRTEIRTYNFELGLEGIVESEGEDEDGDPTEPSILSASFAEAHVLVLRDDSTIQIARVDDSGDLEPPDPPESFAKMRWLDGCLYQGAFTGGQTVALLLGIDGGVQVFNVEEDLSTPLYTMPALVYLPPVLSPEYPQRRVGAKETLTEVLFADIGDSTSKSPMLVVRSATDDITLYEPFHYPSTSPTSAFSSSLRFRKVSNSFIPKWNEEASEASDGRPSPLKALKNVGGYSTVFIPGASPSFIIRQAASLPRIISLSVNNTRALTPYNSQRCQAGFAFVSTDEEVQECTLPPKTRYGDTGWAVRTLGPCEPPEEIQHIAYHADRDMYVFASCREAEFSIPEDESRQAPKEDISFRPQVSQYTIHLLSSATHDLLDSFSLPATELVTSIKVAPLEISEHTHEQKSLIIVGTTLLRGEDLPAKGAVYVFDILDVVPEPGQVETGFRLSVTAREEVKGAITAVEGFPGGLIGTAQGQKIMIRGLKEDRSCLPVAFLDAQCYIATLKTLGSSGFWLAGDAWKGLWFGSFTEEPYKLTLFGKSRSKMEVVAAEFLPFNEQLFLLIVDADCDLHVLQYDPEHPKSLSGQRLLHRSTFHLGHFPTSMSLLPSTLAPFTEQPLTNGHADNNDSPSASAPSLFHVLTTLQSGSVGLLTPLDESTYRRLSALQTHLTSILEHPAGLNPRAYRSVESEGLGARGVVDGSLVQRIGELGAARKSEVLGRAGGDAWQLRSDLEIVGGGGLGYL